MCLGGFIILQLIFSLIFSPRLYRYARLVSIIANFTILLPSAYFIGFLLIIQHC